MAIAHFPFCVHKFVEGEILSLILGAHASTFTLK